MLPFYAFVIERRVVADIFRQWRVADSNWKYTFQLGIMLSRHRYLYLLFSGTCSQRCDQQCELIERGDLAVIEQSIESIGSIHSYNISVQRDT